MNAAEAAAKLDGNQYTKEGSPELFAAMKAAGLVAVFGASDDNMEFRGAIDDEIGAYGGTTAYVTPEGLLANECEEEECPYFLKVRQLTGIPVIAETEIDGFTFVIETQIPHSTFVIKEDDGDYCKGIVFLLADAKHPLTPA